MKYEAELEKTGKSLYIIENEYLYLIWAVERIKCEEFLLINHKKVWFSIYRNKINKTRDVHYLFIEKWLAPKNSSYELDIN